MDTLTDIVMKATNGDKAQADTILKQRMKLTDFGCYEELVHAFSDRCFHLSQVFIIIAHLGASCQRFLFWIETACRTNTPTGSCSFWSTSAKLRRPNQEPYELSIRSVDPAAYSPESSNQSCRSLIFLRNFFPVFQLYRLGVDQNIIAQNIPAERLAVACRIDAITFPIVCSVYGKAAWSLPWGSEWKQRPRERVHVCGQMCAPRNKHSWRPQSHLRDEWEKVATAS